MRFVAAIVIALLPAAALAQGKTTGVDQSASGSTSYFGGSADGKGSSGYGGGSIGSPKPADPGKKRAQQPSLGGNYGYDRQTR